MRAPSPAPGTRPITESTLRACLADADSARRQGDHVRGATLAREAAAAAERLGRPDLAAEAHSLLALHLVRLGDVEAAVASGRQALQELAAHGSQKALSGAHSTLSLAYERAGLNTLAIAHAAQALDVAVACRDPYAECIALNRMGCALDDPQGSQRGLEMLAESEALARKLPHTDALFSALNNLARRWVVEADRLAAGHADPHPALLQALSRAEEAASLVEPDEHAFAAATATANLAGIHRRLGHAEQARAQFEAALAMARQRGYTGLVATLELALASLAAETAPSAQSRQALQQQLAAGGTGVDPDLRLQARRLLVQCCRNVGDLAAALQQMELLHEEAITTQARRSDLQSRLLFSQAERDHARHATERARLDAELQRMRADAERREAHRIALDRDQLAREVTARTLELDKARIAAEAASRAKSAFLSIVSHELRTPLNGVMGMLAVMRRRATDPTQARNLDTATQSAATLSALFDDILDYVAADSGAPAVIEPVDLQELLQGIQQSRQASASARGQSVQVEIEPGLPAQLQTDARRVRRILIALVDNALKFGGPGPVRLRASLEPAVSDAPARLRIEVVDQGPGIEPGAAQRLFQAFEMGDDSSTRRFGGLGLGLALVNRLAETLGAQVGVDHREPVGSAFWLRLDLPAD